MTNKTDRNRLLIAIITLIIFSGFTKLYSQETDGLFYYFTRTDTTYSFKGRFEIDGGTEGELECLLNICFGIDHVRALSVDATNVELVNQGVNWNKISFIYRIFPNYENESTWYRDIDTEKNRVEFSLLSSKNSHAIMPEMISSSGYYKIDLSGETISVEYFQQCLLSESLITDIYLSTVKRRAIEFIYFFRDYAINHCNNFN